MPQDLTLLSNGRRYHPPLMDYPSAQIEMGKDVPFSDEPLEDVKMVNNRYPSCERAGFTSRAYFHVCEDSPEVKRIKAILNVRQEKRNKNQ